MDGMVAGHEDPISAAQRGVAEANDPRLHFQRGQTLLADCESPRPFKSLMGEKQTKIAVHPSLLFVFTRNLNHGCRPVRLDSLLSVALDRM